MGILNKSFYPANVHVYSCSIPSHYGRRKSRIRGGLVNSTSFLGMGIFIKSLYLADVDIYSFNIPNRKSRIGREMHSIKFSACFGTNHS